jgi:hypothetical protein
MRLIDADAIHKFVEEKVAEGKDGWANGVGYEWAWTLTAVDMQPTIDPESLRPQGEWHLFKDEGFLIAECSNCGMIIEATQAAWWDYCPNCGARLYISEDIKR